MLDRVPQPLFVQRLPARLRQVEPRGSRIGGAQALDLPPGVKRADCHGHRQVQALREAEHVDAEPGVGQGQHFFADTQVLIAEHEGRAPAEIDFRQRPRLAPAQMAGVYPVACFLEAAQAGL